MKPPENILIHTAVRLVQANDDGMAFKVRVRRGWLHVIASWGQGWDHVSVSRDDRAPTWEEMEIVKHIAFWADETAMQLHVPQRDHINCHPNCLHLWRPQAVRIPRPPDWMV